MGNDHPAQPATLYTQAGCAESAKVRAWLSERRLAFTEHDVTSDPDAAVALFATGVFATPLLVVGEEKVLGFRPQKLAAALADRTESRSPLGPNP
ncbi:MAG: glutaredoxin family protein [Chloroflexota bacterium]|nr:glutaredoxin family protein [Chloroflexota bacterium]